MNNFIKENWLKLLNAIILMRNIFKKFIQNCSHLLIKKKKDISRSKLSKFALSKTKFKQKKFTAYLLIGLIILTIIAGISYEIYRTSKLVVEAEKLTKEERYNESNEKLELAKAKLIVNNLGIKKQEIIKKIDENKKLEEDKSKYNQGLNNLNSNNFQEAIDILSTFSEDSFYYQKAQTKIEESKRMIVEGKLSIETIAKLSAETKAKQEEFEKKLKEQQLADKETTEKMMNADNDGDGLSYRQELALGTSDWDTDSDNDGIIDNEDSHPAGGDRLIAQHFEWTYSNESWKWDYSFPSDWYDYYKNKVRVPQGISYVTSDNIYIKRIADMLKKGAEENSYAKSAFAAAFVQSLGYVSDDMISYNDYPKYPLETLAEQNGDCEDTSYLASAIISAMGIDNSLVLLPGHMSIAIAFSGSPSGYYYLNNGRDYYYIETTGTDWQVGEIPDEFKYTRAKLINEYYKEAEVYPSYRKPCAASDFSGYYYDGKNYYSDSQCNNLTYCLLYKEYYYNTQTEKLYWDNDCAQMVVKGCAIITGRPGYYCTVNSINHCITVYVDSSCTQKALEQ